jgi:ribose transport system substrate-binding protein
LGGAYRLDNRSYFWRVMKKLKFLVSLHTKDNDFQMAQASAAEVAAHKFGVDAEVTFADNNAVNQSTQILKAIQNRPESRPDAIVLEPVSGTALPQVARAANAAGIGWVVLNRDPEYMPDLHRRATAPTFAVSSDHDEIGRIQGKQFAALLPKGGSILYLEGPSQSSSAQKRTAGMLETKPLNIQVVMLKGRWTEESAERAVVSWLKLATSQNKAIDLVGAQDDAMAMGARRAFEKVTNEEERTRWLSLPFTGCDGQLETGQAWVRQGWLAATIYLPPLAGTAIEILAKAMQEGTRPPERTMTVSFSIPTLDTLAPRTSQPTTLSFPVRKPITPSRT